MPNMEEGLDIVKSALRHAKSLVQRSRQENVDSNIAQRAAVPSSTDQISPESLFLDLHRLAASMRATKSGTEAQIDLILSTLSLYEKRIFALSGEVDLLRKEREEMYRQTMIFRHDIEDLANSIVSKINSKIEYSLYPTINSTMISS